MQKYDVVIIGSGVSGMTAGIYLKRGGINTLIIEGDTPGGQLNRASSIKNYPGFKEIDGPTLAYSIYEQLNSYNIDYLYEKVTEVNLDDKIITTQNNEIAYDYLIIATGRVPRKLNLDNEEKLIGHGISYCALCDGNLYKDKEIIIVGGGNSALQEAIHLSKICKKVTIIHRRDTFKAEREVIDDLSNYANINIIYNANVIRYNIMNDKLYSVTLDNNEEIKIDGIFISIGYDPATDIFNLDKDNGYIIVGKNYETSIKDVYACGDVIKKDTYQLTTSAGEATVVANQIIHKITNNQK